MKFSHNEVQGHYEYNSGVWRGPDDKIIHLGPTETKIARLFLDAPRYRLSADEIQNKITGESVSSSGDPTAYRQHVSKLNGKLGINLLVGSGDPPRTGGPKSRRKVYRLAPEINFHGSVANNTHPDSSLGIAAQPKPAMYTSASQSSTEGDREPMLTDSRMRPVTGHVSKPLAPLLGISGRKTEAHALVERLVQQRRLVIGGGPNIGKSTLAQVLLRELVSHPKYGNSYATRTWDIRCDGMATHDDLIRQMGKQWFEEESASSGSVIRWLNEKPTTILIDNYETFTHVVNEVERSKANEFLLALLDCRSLLILIGIQGDKSPDALTRGHLYFPKALSDEACMEIFRYHAPIVAVSDDDLLKFVEEVGHNPFVLQLIAQTAKTDLDTFPYIYRRWCDEDEKDELLKRDSTIDVALEDDRGSAHHIAYRIALKSLANRPESLAAALFLAHVDYGIARSDEASHIGLLAGRALDDKNGVKLGLPIYEEIYGRGLAYFDAASQRIRMLDPVRHVLKSLLTRYIKNHVSADIYKNTLHLVRQSIKQYCGILDRAVWLGKDSDRSILESIYREFPNILWAVRSYVTSTFSDDEAEVIPRDASDVLDKLNKFCSWTGVGQREFDEIATSLIRSLDSGRVSLARGHVEQMLAESQRMQGKLEASDESFKDAINSLAAQGGIRARIIKAGCNIGIAENLRERYNLTESRDLHLTNIAEHENLIALLQGPGGPTDVVDSEAALWQLQRRLKGIPWRIAKAYSMEFLWVEAEHHFRDSLARYSSPINDGQGRGSCLRELAEVKRFNQAHEDALTLFEQAVDCYAGTSGINYVGLCLKEQLECMYLLKRDYQRQVTIEQRAYEILSKIDRHIFDAQWCKWLRGTMYSALEASAEAKDLWEEVISTSEDLVATKRRAPEDVCILYAFCSYSLSQLGIVSERASLRYKLNALKIWGKIGQDDNKNIWKMKEMGEVAVKMGMLDTAEECWERALSLGQKSRSAFPLDQMTRQLAWLRDLRSRRFD